MVVLHDWYDTSNVYLFPCCNVLKSTTCEYRVNEIVINALKQIMVMNKQSEINCAIYARKVNKSRTLYDKFEASCNNN